MILPEKLRDAGKTGWQDTRFAGWQDTRFAGWQADYSPRNSSVLITFA